MGQALLRGAVECGEPALGVVAHAVGVLVARRVDSGLVGVRGLLGAALGLVEHAEVGPRGGKAGVEIGYEVLERGNGRSVVAGVEDANGAVDDGRLGARVIGEVTIVIADGLVEKLGRMGLVVIVCSVVERRHAPVKVAVGQVEQGRGVGGVGLVLSAERLRGSAVLGVDRLHGVGVKAVNALSTYVEVTVYRDGKIHRIRFENGGHTIAPGLEVIGECPEEKTGTTVEFTPDPTIFRETTTFDYNTIKTYLRQTAYLTKGVDIVLEDLRDKDNILRSHYCFAGGIKEYVEYINQEKEKVFEAVPYVIGEATVPMGEESTTIIVECAMQPTKGGLLSMNSFCNNIRTSGGGTHEEGFRLAIGRELNNYFRTKGWLKENDSNFKSEDCLEGLTVVISIKHSNPQYEGQVKDKLGNDEVRKVVSSIVGDYLKEWLMENPKEGKAWYDRVVLAFKSRRAAENARAKIQGKLSIGAGMPDKLTDCISKDPKERELFIVEGNSAGGSAVQGRDARTQAVLPLRGKILNVEKAPATRIEKNAEIYNLVTAIGAGQGESFDVSKIRYDKVIIMTDADVDGSHIRILLMTFFYRFMRPLVETGHLYIAQPPLYRVAYQGHYYYAFNDEELEVIKSKLPQNARYGLQRYKGLGEMDAEQLDSTTMDKNHRRMYQVTIDDAQEANDALIDLMGENVDPRKDYITANAKFVKNLDI